MTNEIYLEHLLVQQNNYNKVGNLFSKEDYFYVELNYYCITARVRHSDDNYWTKFEIDNWQKLERTTLYDVLQKNKFIS